LRIPSPPAAIGASLASRRSDHDPVAGRVVQGPQRQRHEPDYLLLIAGIGLAAIGILMVYSSGGVEAAVSGSVFDAITTQLVWALIGVAALIFCMRLDYRLLRLFSVLGFAVTLGFLVLVLLPPMPPLIMPKEVGGAARWLRIGGLPAFHPAEFAKLALIVYLAHWLTTRGRDVGSLRHGLLPFLVIAGSVIGLVAIEPDLGTTGVITLTAFAMFFVAGGSIWQLALVVPVGVAAVAGYISMRDYQMARWETFLDPWSVAGADGYQTVQGIYALALGGQFGEGLGVSRQPGGLYLPNAGNDFIFAVVGQELGLAGGLLVIGLFVLLAWRGIRVALAAPDTFGGLVALGITAWLTFQAFINIGVVVNLLPLTGLPLPFVSDGGTSLVVSLAAVGILLSISREALPRGDAPHEDPDRGRGHRRPHLPRPGRRDPALDAAP
jgi:cell division protein FtsW